MAGPFVHGTVWKTRLTANIMCGLVSAIRLWIGGARALAIPSRGLTGVDSSCQSLVAYSPVLAEVQSATVRTSTCAW